MLAELDDRGVFEVGEGKGGDHISGGELRVLKQVPHQPLGQEMLDQHLVDVGFGKIRIQRRAAERDEPGEGLAEFPILLVGLGDMLAEGLRRIGNAALELVHGAFEIALMGLVVRQEAVEEIRDLDRLGEGEPARFAAVLVEDGHLCVFKDRVTGRVAGLEFFLDLGGQMAGGVFRLPPPACQPVLVAHGAVGHDASSAGVSGEFRHQHPAALLGSLVEKVVERAF